MNVPIVPDLREAAIMARNLLQGFNLPVGEGQALAAITLDALNTALAALPAPEPPPGRPDARVRQAWNACGEVAVCEFCGTNNADRRGGISEADRRHPMFCANCRAGRDDRFVAWVARQLGPPNFAHLRDDFLSQETVVTTEHKNGFAHLDATPLARDYLNAFVGFLTRRFSEYVRPALPAPEPPDTKIAALLREADEATHPLRAIHGWDNDALGELVTNLARALREER